ncbi:MAG: type III ribulose-bisphosphate carboxylase [Candidatus Nanoarchaeia archaeon]
MGNYDAFVNTKYKPKSTDLLVHFKVKVPKWSKPKRSYGAVAAESSVGTWSKVKGGSFKHVQKVGAKVYSMGKGGNIKIAYPYEHFEEGNMGQILASIAGNVFGMKAVDALRIEDIRWPKKLMKSFPGPQFGIQGVRKIFKVKKRPLIVSVPKPKVGMTTKEHAKIGYDIWTGGFDLLKDDENLTSQKFNPFEKRLKLCMKYRDKAEKETGERKSYLLNVTHTNYSEVKKRVKLAADYGNEYVMFDICAAGWAGLGTLRELTEEYGLAIHAHRAFHASFTRNKNHGMSMLNVAEIARLMGVDNIHIGTIGIGKLVGDEKEVLQIEHHITQDRVIGTKFKKLNEVEDWSGIKPLFPVSSGGLHPGVLGSVIKHMGTDIMVQLGGGCHGHPKGSHWGALAGRAAVDAAVKGISVDEAAKENKALSLALKTWGHMKTR